MKMNRNKMYRAFKNALAGLGYFFRHERNGRIQLVLGGVTIFFSVKLHISRVEWMIVLLCSGCVLFAEMINSALEKLCDHIEPSFHLQIKIIKDIAAAAVLFISIISAIIGAFIFLPRLW